jgi:hypothetical protein
MKVKSVDSIQIYTLKIMEEDSQINFYQRAMDGEWSMLMGMAWEPVLSDEKQKQLEKAFTEYMITNTYTYYA